MSPSHPSLSLNSSRKVACVLVIEDNNDHWQLIDKAIEQYLPGVATRLASTAQQAMALLTEWCQQEWELPKLILLDLYLPQRQDGYSLIRQIKSLPASVSRIPIVTYSSSNRQEDILQAYQLGTSAYVIKPALYHEWNHIFMDLKEYWWNTVNLPPLDFSA